MFLEYLAMKKRGKLHAGINWGAEWAKALKSPTYKGATQFKSGVHLMVRCTYMYTAKDMPSGLSSGVWEGALNAPIEHIPVGVVETAQIFGSTIQVVEGPTNKIEVEIYPLEPQLI